MTNPGWTGVDPGLVHTGIVAVLVDETHRTLTVRHEIVTGYSSLSGFAVDATATAVAVEVKRIGTEHVFVEKYQPRSHFDTDERMTALVREISRGLSGRSKVISNTGSKQTLSPQLMQILGIDRFPATHHQDLQAAARIGLYGALKDETLNHQVFVIARDHIDGHPWTVKKEA